MWHSPCNFTVRQIWQLVLTGAAAPVLNPTASESATLSRSLHILKLRTLRCTDPPRSKIMKEKKQNTTYTTNEIQEQNEANTKADEKQRLPCVLSDIAALSSSLSLTVAMTTKGRLSLIKNLLISLWTIITWRLMVRNAARMLSFVIICPNWESEVFHYWV